MGFNRDYKTCNINMYTGVGPRRALYVKTRTLNEWMNPESSCWTVCECVWLDSKGSSSQTEEDDFSGGAWAAMKAEMGLDERNPLCFLHSYSVVMVLRKVTCHDITRVLLFSYKHKYMEEILKLFPLLSLYKQKEMQFLFRSRRFLKKTLFSSIIIITVSLLEVCWNNQDKWRSSTRGVL